jgi:hypothetical protein
MPLTLTPNQARSIYTVLIDIAGAYPRQVDCFIQAQTHQPLLEYRFRGSLGDGGKFWNSDNPVARGQFYVTCYPEDLTPGREAVIAAVNQKLTEIAAEIAEAPNPF